MPGHQIDEAVIAVVGASGALGSRIASKLAEQGARVIAVGRDRDKLDAAQIPGAVLVEGDLSDATLGDRVVEAAVELGALDGVINAAGVVAFGPLADTDDAVIEDLFMTNVIGPLWLTRRITPMLSEANGFLVNISAVVAEKPLPGMVAYAASKAALTAADQALARELRRAKITVIDVRPLHTETGLATRPLAGEAPKLPEGLEPEVVVDAVIGAIESGQNEVEASSFA